MVTIDAFRKHVMAVGAVATSFSHTSGLNFCLRHRIPTTMSDGTTDEKNKEHDIARGQAGIDDDDEPDDWYGKCSARRSTRMLTAVQGQAHIQYRMFRCGSSRLRRCMSLMIEVENAKLNDCYFDKKDWRACKDEVRLIADFASVVGRQEQCSR